MATDQAAKGQAFFEFFQSLMGTASLPSLDINWTVLYQQQQPILHNLTAPITENEVLDVIASWPNNKSPGPDGFTGEFFKFFAADITPDLTLTLNFALQHGSLSPINSSHIILIPKLDNPTEPKDFRPISIVHSAQKILSKILANRLMPLLPDLVHPSQTGFIKGRLITENFIYAQHLLHHFANQHIPLAVFKADIYKAFDTVSWSFISNILRAMGIPHVFVDWILNCVLQGKSQVVVNGLVGRVLTLKRGVRQGDPVSPYLFILAMDFLARWLLKLHENGTMLFPFSNMLPCLLYADDALFFFKPCIAQSQLLNIIFHFFQRVSGLSINPEKSELVFLNTEPALRAECARTLRCTERTLPIKYLGLPLSSKKLSKSDYLILIDRFKAKLDTWSSAFLSFAGRLVLVNTCISSLSIFFMSVFKIPKWVVKILDNTRRSFLWQGRSQKKKLVTVSWNKVCSPKLTGGLGVLDLETFNLALLSKWLWKWNSHEFSNFKTLLTALSGSYPSLPSTSPLHETFRQILPIFTSVTYFKLKSGSTTSFWQQNWGLGLLCHSFSTLYSYSIDHDIFVLTFLQQLHSPFCLFRPIMSTNLMAIEQLNQLLIQIQQLLQHTTPNSDLQDQICCKLTADKLTSAAFYKFSKLMPKIPSDLSLIWNLKVPPRVSTFTWLLLQNKLPTMDNLQLRGFILINRCALCKSDCESIQHIFDHCLFSSMVLQQVLNLSGTPQIQIPANLAFLTTDITAKQKEILAIAWYFIWRERCSRVFSEKHSNTHSLAMLIIEEWRLLHPD
ncbi:RNA-directed DNA polymerase (reverse transcriptase)-related family protein [Rhynchospora pubera]|uniref:RNA-directed DNA polymerase (Reverse transcriptase)-related family protein n=1 Tax=Rhynchospora pubera TaxID=906938 RepID=A0AAV8FJ56_9POAL|nr:RNA-directed DNA polymerase (reverse transcriptase)-related family protein [Rhynchospora pubera]